MAKKSLSDVEEVLHSFNCQYDSIMSFEMDISPNVKNYRLKGYNNLQ